MNAKVTKKWSVYLLSCADETLYCGITNDLGKRLRQHNGEIQGGAKYTASRRPCQLVYQEAVATRSCASQREYQIKKMSRLAKQRLIDTTIS
ncbi:GIY-YIG nuclease family protein [Thiomicrorhabdus sediminis]|uniref:GIY-YIG nuclease family protein n=1 Tax=Thiomicrorhabdus sediminis TaxID=2580412 RepID=A0A4P9K356_9GAMM|nr:GIY-YIG nuclease family protein [Thiomicrorhabdus sediminis]QCU89255.1 GIY-YIG nuclease family protein [Thiomicrorhabdus sediminis]